ncbi:MAG: NACHT domain-containing protein [Cyanobacteria bacterium P01_A01_bin.116]
MGPPGSGKSTLLEHMALVYARSRQRIHSRNAPMLIPVLLYLRDIREIVSRPNAPSLPQLLGQQTRLADLNLSNWFASKLSKGKCLVMLDGLDEVANHQQRIEVSKWVKEQISSFSNSHFVITSRPYGYKDMPLDGMSVTLEVQPFTLTQMKDFIHHWYLQSELMRHKEKEDEGMRQAATSQAAELIKRIVAQPALSKLALNPLLLTMIATVHHYRGALPGKRVELYDEICDVLLGRRQDAKSISDSLTAIQKKTVLQHLALQLMKKDVRGFSLSEGASLVKDRLNSITNQMNAHEFLQDIENKSGLLVERERDIYEFTHKSFQEYLAATELKSLREVDFLVGMMHDEAWAETIRLYSAQSDATPFIQVALNSDRISVISLAFDCLEEKLIVEPIVQERFEKRLLYGLTSLKKREFQLAAKTRLARRLNKFLRIDENTAIDTTCITCAEYQLFIDDQWQQGKIREPDHWPNNRFPENTATDPIRGVRADDAVAFCRWLSQQDGKQYRLPSLEESRINTAEHHGIGRWVTKSESIILSFHEKSSKQVQCWASSLKMSLLKMFREDFDYALSHTLVHNSSDYERSLECGIRHIQRCSISIDCVRSFTRDGALAYNIDIERMLTIAKNFSSEREASRSSKAKQEKNRELLNIQNLENLLRLEITHQVDAADKYDLAWENYLRIQKNRESRELELSGQPLSATEIKAEKDAKRHSDITFSQLERIKRRIKILNRDLENAKDQSERHSHTRQNDLEKARVAELSYELDFAGVIALNLSLNRALNTNLDNALKHVSNLDEVCSYLTMYIVFWDILFRFYEQYSYNHKWSLFERNNFRIYQTHKAQCMRNLKKATQIYTFFIVVRLRQIEAIPSWEGIQLVRQEV